MTTSDCDVRDEDIGTLLFLLFFFLLVVLIFFWGLILDTVVPRDTKASTYKNFRIRKVMQRIFCFRMQKITQDTKKKKNLKFPRAVNF